MRCRHDLAFESVLGGGKFANGAITSAFAYAATGEYSDSENQVDPRRSDGYGNTYGPPYTGTLNCGDTVCRYQYQTYEDAYGNRGERIYVIGNGSDTNWVQTVSDNGGAPQIDCDYSPCPLYNAKPFFDRPEGQRTFTAETSLIQPNQNGGYDAVVTFRWGYQVTPTTDTLLPIQVVPPSNFQLQQIRGAHQ